MKFISNFKLFLSLIIIFIILNIFTSKVITNLRSKVKTHTYEPHSFTPKELQYIKDFDNFGDKMDNVQNSSYFDILKLGSGIRNSYSNKNNNIKSSNPYRFIQKTNKKRNSYPESEEIPMNNIKNTQRINNKYKGVIILNI
jgi:hypothetical protein